MTVVKICKMHGELDFSKVIKAKVTVKGEQRYRCKLCMQELHKPHYEKNREKVLTAHATYRNQDPKKYQEIKNASKRKMYALHLDKYRKDRDEREKRNPEKKKLRQQRYKNKSVESLSDAYIKQNLVRETNLKFADVPQELVETKRASMQFKRLIKSKLNNKEE